MRSMLLVLVAVVVAHGTAADAPPAQPPFVDQLIAAMSAAPPTNPPSRILRYTYHGATVYLVTARCCDVPSALYDGNGQRLCEPDGGFAGNGNGDGKCADFREQRRDEGRVWRDLRKSP